MRAASNPTAKRSTRHPLPRAKGTAWATRREAHGRAFGLGFNETRKAWLLAVLFAGRGVGPILT